VETTNAAPYSTKPKHASCICALESSSQAMHKQSLEEPDRFWGDAAHSTLKWFRDFDRVSQGGFETGDVAWFTGGQLNACYNCIDQHLPRRAKQVCELRCQCGW
ncbi:unnamed protein product, partial [Hapterophycus canaliculatus]